MNYDEITHHILLDFYESLSKNPNLIDSFYKTNSKLIISYPNEPQKVSLSNRFESLPKGDHKIFRWNGQKNGDQIIGHATGYIKIKAENNNDNNNNDSNNNNNNNDNNNNDNKNNDHFYQCNEMIVYMHTIQDQNIKYPYQILYHSIHLSNMDPPPQPELKLEKKTGQNTEQPKEKQEEEKTTEPSKPSPSIEPAKIPESTKSAAPTSKPSAVESKPPPPDSKQTQQLASSKINEEKHPILVENPNILIKSRTVLATNLPYNVAQSSILQEFDVYGIITRYAVVKGRILIEFENPNSLVSALNDGNFYWKGRYIKIKQMEDQFN